jgi:hypothetical protein
MNSWVWDGLIYFHKHFLIMYPNYVLIFISRNITRGYQLVIIMLMYKPNLWSDFVPN